ncbi:MAG: hypothetical protein K8J08_18880 [Thermoanaerobaculia bacterium]|nr:hypothetical protein [Thermoanaerobaculia bacterium]
MNKELTENFELTTLQLRLSRFLDDSRNDDFDSLAVAGCRLQAQEIPALARLAESQGLDLATIEQWQDIPLVPTLAFKSQALHVGPPIETFRSSGTRGVGPSLHYHVLPQLYRQVIDRSFARSCLGDLQRPPMLALVPDREQQPDSSLSFMVDHILTTHGRADSVHAMGRRGVDITAARSWIGARQREGAPAVLLATSLALSHLLEAFEKRYLHFRLAPGSVVFETGGFKGETVSVSPEQQLERLGAFLGLPPSGVVREYGMTELTSQAYAHAEDGWRYRLPHWARVRALDPETLEAVVPGQPGLLAFLDLANLGSALHVLTEDVGRVFDDGSFQLDGRATDAELRGCSLTAEQLVS